MPEPRPFKPRGAGDPPVPRALAAAALAWALSSLAAPPPAGPIPAEDLFRAEPLGEARLSPDGRHLGAIIKDTQDLKELLIFDLRGGKTEGLSGSGSFEVSTFHWLDNARVIFSVSKDKVYTWGLYSAAVDHLDRFKSIDRFDGTQVIGVPAARPGHALVWIKESAWDGGRPGPLLELDASRTTGSVMDGRDWNPMVRTYEMPENYFAQSGGGSAMVRSFKAPQDGPVLAWDCDRQGDLAICATWVDGRSRLHRYDRDADTWSDIHLPPGARPMALDPDRRFMWIVTHSNEKGYELRLFNLDTGELGPSVLTDASYDFGVGHLFFSAVGHNLAGVTYARRGRVSVWFSSAFAGAQATVDKHLPGTDNVLIDRDDAEKKFLYLCSGPQHPGTLELLDLEARTLRTLANEAPWLRDRKLRPAQAIQFRTRDGAELEGYLTMPEGAGLRRPAPMVVLCHGGPWQRDVADYNPEVQFLASRGYAVLQPNYRGSTGYSLEISHEHRYDFRRMIDDVTDATRSVVASGVVDPARVAIMGASFGGYLAVGGVAFESGLYRCAITECGVFDWERQIKSKSDVGRPGEYEQLLDELGKPGKDSGYLGQISPLEYASHIHVPVLIAHGTEDSVVDIEQSKKLASELKRQGVPYETFFRALEGHGFYSYRDRVEFFHRVEAFLAANLGGATLTPVK